MKNYKEIRDRFMHSDGTTAYETLSVIVPSAFLCFVACLLMSLSMKAPDSSFPVLRLTAELILTVIPIVLIVTVFAQYATNIVISLLVISVSLCFVILKVKSGSQSRPKKKINVSKQDFITLCRATINIMSVIGILAVDFRIFPRTFAKTANFGYSLMDTGVGLYVFANGIVAPEIRGYRNSVAMTLKSVLPLIVLGGARFLATKEVDYHVPVSEYGIHWNFFITLATVKMFSSLILSIISVDNSIFSAVSVLLAHEIMLQLGLAEYVLNDNVRRDTFFKANREGIVSSSGYVGLYFLSVAYGLVLHKGGKTRGSKLRFFLKLCAVSVFLLWATLILEKNFGVSRRLANAGYCVWIMFVASFMATLFYLIESVQDFVYEYSNTVSCIKVPLIYESVNYNGLIFFLLANLSTGVINMSVDTLNVNTILSLIIIITYMWINCFVSYVLFVKRIKLKLT